jgi:hypothetical protein
MEEFETYDRNDIEDAIALRYLARVQAGIAEFARREKEDVLL